MNNRNWPLVLLLIPLVLACSQIESITEPEKGQLQKGTRTVDLPGDVASAAQEDLTEKDLVIVTLDGEGTWIGEESHAPEELAKVIENLLANKTPEERAVYVQAARDLSYEQVIEALEAVRDADIDRAMLIVRKDWEGSAKMFGVLEVRLPKRPDPDPDPEVKPNPLILVAERKAGGKTTLNGEEMDLEKLRGTLERIFKERMNNGVYREGTNEVEKTVWIRAAPGTTYEDGVGLIDAVREAGAQPVVLGLKDPSGPWIIIEEPNPFEE